MRSKNARFGSWGAAVAFLLLSSNLLANTTEEEALENLPAELVSKAKAGDAEAQFEIGKRLDSGQGVEADPKLAADWYRKAALQGHPKAAEYLAIFYEEGIGVVKDLEKAKEWRERAKAPGKTQSSSEPLNPDEEIKRKIADIDQLIKKLHYAREQLKQRLSERQKPQTEQHIAPKEVHASFVRNKVKLTITFRHKGGFLGAEKVDTYETETIILVDGKFAFILVHGQDSPFRLEPFHRKLIEVSGTITGKGNNEPIIVNEVAFMDDPRLLIIPIYVNPLELAEKYDVELFPAKNAGDAFHTDAVLVGATNYRQANFVNDYGNDKYIRTVGFHSPAGTTKFYPGKGDLVFSKSGEVLGIMVNNDYAFQIQNLGARIRMGTRTPLGKSFDALKTNDLLESLGKSLKSLEQKFR